MEKLFRVARGEVSVDDEGLSAYSDLVFNRFYDCIETSFPIFTSFVGEAVLSEMVRAFLKESHPSPLLLDVSRSFLHFFKERKHKVKERLPFLEEVLEYEWIGIELFNAPEGEPAARFEWEGRYSLSPSSKLIEFSYPVRRAEELGEEISKLKGSCKLLMFRDPESFEVRSVELTELTFSFLKEVLTFKRTPLKALNLLREVIDPDEAKPYLERFFEELIRKGVLSGA